VHILVFTSLQTAVGKLKLTCALRAGMVAACMLVAGMPAFAQSVVFLNPGKSDEAYWRSSAQAMQKAADSLGMQLRVLYAQRNRLEPVAMAQKLANLPKSERPDYVVFSNDYSTAPSILKALEGSGIQAFMAFSGIQEELRPQVGVPRGKFPFWLGSLEPNAEDAGYLTAQALIQKALKMPPLRDGQGKLQMVAIAGDRSTPASIARNQGMRKAVREAQGMVVLRQEVYGEWRQDKARDQALGLFQRYPEVRLVWAGNDLMAFGAMDAWRQQGGLPGTDALFSGINTSEQAFDWLRKGQLTALAGGHFMAGAWAMVMLYDHYRGVDFLDEGLELRRNMFELFDARNSQQFEQHFSQTAARLDFRAFSKHLNPQLRRYQFELARLLR
jgi:ABC-type sugar transport system substrate-binding protein